MRILLASSEVHPYSKTGGLGDMVGALAKVLGRAGHKAGVVTPLYLGVQERFPEIRKMDWSIDLPVGAQRVTAEVWTLEPSEGVTYYFIHQPRFYFRNHLYGEAGSEYADNPQRFIFLSKCVAQLARYLPWQPEIVHLHDWQTALVPALVQHQRLAEGWWSAPRTVLTIHNLAYQGRYRGATYDLANLPRDYFNPNGAEFYTGFNFLKGGISYADFITTVSPRYAREITTLPMGEMLDGALRRRQESGTLAGILNGVDYDEWNTIRNPHLKQPYHWRNLAGKVANKAALQTEMGLPVRSDAPLFATISRLVDQKGIDLLLGALEEMLASDMQFVLLGSGLEYFQDGCVALARRHPQKVSVRIGFDTPLSHRIEAGADFFLMPSRFEPSGLNQMYSLRYGTVPVVRITGGLDDSVIDIAEDAARANGIKFAEYSVRALAKAIRKALALYGEPSLLARYRRNGMKADFSWERTCRNYIEIYSRLAGQIQLPPGP
jgi:starch synthase